MAYINFDVYAELKGNIPRSIETEIRRISKELKIPFGRLIAIAIDNELDQPKPFNYPAELPTDEYQETAYLDQAVKIMNFLKANGGFTLDSLMLARRRIGIVTKKEILYAVRELFEAQQIEFYTPRKGFFDYDDDHKMIRVKKHGEKPGKPDKRRSTLKQLEEKNRGK